MVLNMNKNGYIKPLNICLIYRIIKHSNCRSVTSVNFASSKNDLEHFFCKNVFVSSDPACTDVLGVDFRPGFAS